MAPIKKKIPYSFHRFCSRYGL